MLVKIRFWESMEYYTDNGSVTYKIIDCIGKTKVSLWVGDIEDKIKPNKFPNYCVVDYQELKNMLMESEFMHNYSDSQEELLDELDLVDTTIDIIGEFEDE